MKRIRQTFEMSDSAQIESGVNLTPLSTPTAKSLTVERSYLAKKWFRTISCHCNEETSIAVRVILSVSFSVPGQPGLFDWCFFFDQRFVVILGLFLVLLRFSVIYSSLLTSLLFCRCAFLFLPIQFPCPPAAFLYYFYRPLSAFCNFFCWRLAAVCFYLLRSLDV